MLLWLGFVNEDDVGIGVAADQAQLLAVEAPVEVVNVLRSEVGDLPSWGTVQRLRPQIVDASNPHRIHHSFAIGRKSKRAIPGLFKRQGFV